MVSSSLEVSVYVHPYKVLILQTAIPPSNHRLLTLILSSPLTRFSISFGTIVGFLKCRRVGFNVIIDLLLLPHAAYSIVLHDAHITFITCVRLASIYHKS